MTPFWFTLISSVAAGSIAYLITNFWINPILRYRDIKYQIASNLVFFANAIELQKTDGSLRPDTLEREKANRRSASDLEALIPFLPKWYRYVLSARKEKPEEAAKDLIGLSNQHDFQYAKELALRIKINLNMPFNSSDLRMKEKLNTKLQNQRNIEDEKS